MNNDINTKKEENNFNPNLIAINLEAIEMLSDNSNPNNNQMQSINIANNDKELIQIFIGKNYDKINGKIINFAALFFTSFYMCYRKMFILGILNFILMSLIINFTNNIIIFIIYSIIIGLIFNKLYISYSQNKIKKIKNNNIGKDYNEIKEICKNNGGVSIPNIFIGLVIVIVISIIMMFVGIGNTLNNIFDFSSNKTENNKYGTLLKDVTINGYSCTNSNCTYTLETSSGENEFICNYNENLFEILSDYSDYVKLNIYYTKKGENRTINKYEIYLKSTGEKLSDVSTEEELRTKIGLYNAGTYTNKFILKKIGSTGFGISGNDAYVYTDYLFVADNNIEYIMHYIETGNVPVLNLIEGNKYDVTFDVSKGTFKYEYFIKSIVN